VTANGQVRGGAHAAAIAVLAPTDAIVAAAKLTRQLIDLNAQADEGSDGAFARLADAQKKAASVEGIRAYLAALKEVRT
jgi:hypothetical protein